MSGVKFFVRAVVTGFGLSLGAALFKKIQDRLGLGEPKEKSGKSGKAEQAPAEPEAVTDPVTDPSLPS
ncbi:MAG TPA: hypothetical protein VNO30_39390 [Kofleriaceae bacterium]|nr:hypothetical protein [Kofleriaceae bacterium]